MVPIAQHMTQSPEEGRSAANCAANVGVVGEGGSRYRKIMLELELNGGYTTVEGNEPIGRVVCLLLGHRDLTWQHMWRAGREHQHCHQGSRRDRGALLARPLCQAL